jgi:hypothetical protein
LVNDPSRLALEALAWILADGIRAHRFLDLTGLDPDGLRGSVTSASMHRAVLEFLCAHEPDLIAASEALGVPPQELAAARDRIAA